MPSQQGAEGPFVTLTGGLHQDSIVRRAVHRLLMPAHPTLVSPLYSARGKTMGYPERANNERWLSHARSPAQCRRAPMPWVAVLRPNRRRTPQSQVKATGEQGVPACCPGVLPFIHLCWSKGKEPQQRLTTDLREAPKTLQLLLREHSCRHGTNLRTSPVPMASALSVAFSANTTGSRGRPWAAHAAPDSP